MTSLNCAANVTADYTKNGKEIQYHSGDMFDAMDVVRITIEFN